MKMKQKFIALLSILFLLNSCLKDTGKLTYYMYTPVYKTSADVRAAIKSDAPQPIVTTGKIYLYNNTIFLNERNKGVHIIDNSNPANPVNKGFINIPGNEDIAIRNNILYADCFTDLLAIDISDINNVVLKNYVGNIYPEKRYMNGLYLDSGKVVVDWIKETVTKDAKFYGGWNNKVYYDAVSLQNFSSTSSAPSFVGQGGSMAKITIIDNRLYTTSQSTLHTLNIANANTTSFLNKTQVALNITGFAETIYPFQDKLFIGSSSGMYIYSIANPNLPSYISQFTHARACDPVITDGTHAYITLHAGTPCTGLNNQLDVVNVSNIQSPVFVKTYSMSKPMGLAKDGNTLMVCDNVVKFYDATNANNLQLKNTINLTNAYDIILNNKTAIIVAKDGLYQYNFTNVLDIQLISKINITK